MTKKVVLITGCSGNGIGFHVAKAFYAAGCKVVMTARSLSKLQHIGEDVEQVMLDVCDADSIAQCVREVESKLGRIDILVNNAGQGCIGPLVEVEMAKARQTFATNVFGLLAVTQEVSKGMIAHRSGLVINISSIVSHVPTPWAGIYCATKASVTSMSDVLRMELQGFGINVMTVYPGAIRSSIGAANAKAFEAKKESHYANLSDQILARATWSQCAHSTPTEELAETIVKNALQKSPPNHLTAGYRSSMAWWSTFLPFSVRDYLWGRQFGIADVGKQEKRGK